MSFENLGLSSSVLRAVRHEGYETASPIQAKAIPIILQGRDIMGCAQTGTGKTAAFALPTLHRLEECRKNDGDSKTYPRPSADTPPPAEPARGRGSKGGRGKKKHHRHNQRDAVPDRPIRTLVLAPTRELAVQVAASFAKYGRFMDLRTSVIYGGVSQNPQVRALQRGVDIVVACPGRLLDLRNQGHVDLSNIEMLILDEADQMLDMGFLPDLQRIVEATPTSRQTLMFSATMPSEIRRLASRWLQKPEHIQVAPISSPVESVRQSVFFVDARHKPQLLTHYLQQAECRRTLIFSRTKHGADKIVKHLTNAGIRAAAIHGNKSQNARARSLEQFKSKQPPVLVATDIAARGLDVDAVTHVINYDLPEAPETYVHRIGRTGRAGASGIATSFCGGGERGQLKRIERLTRQSIEVERDQPKYTTPPRPEGGESREASRGGSRGQGGGRGSYKGRGKGPGKGKGRGPGKDSKGADKGPGPNKFRYAKKKGADGKADHAEKSQAGSDGSAHSGGESNGEAKSQPNLLPSGGGRPGGGRPGDGKRKSNASTSKGQGPRARRRRRSTTASK